MNTLCPRKDVCGSCGWSHIPYAAQLQQKQNDIQGSFRLKQLPHVCPEVLPSPKTAHYRNRMDFVIDFQGKVGLRQKGKWWRVIDGHCCFLSEERIEQAFADVRAWTQQAGLTFFDRNTPHRGTLRYAVIRANRQGGCLLHVITSDPALEEGEERVRAALEDLARKAAPESLTWGINHTVSDTSTGDEVRVLSGPGWLEEEVGGTRYRIGPQAFFQTNAYGAEQLLATVVELAGPLEGKTLLDLYCGSGFFSVALARRAARTVGLELVEEAIADARVNAAENGVEVEYRVAKIEDQPAELLDAEVVILDPPRSGMHDRALHSLLTVRPPLLVYVSCNPKNFARELVLLQEYYRVEELRPIDMFPHTPHVELVARLVRKA